MAAPLFTLQSSGSNTVCLLYCSCACWEQHFKDFYVHLKVSFLGCMLWNLTHYIWCFKKSVRLPPRSTIYSFLTNCVLRFMSRNLNDLNLLYLIAVREASLFVVPFHWFLAWKPLLCTALSEAIMAHVWSLDSTTDPKISPYSPFLTYKAYWWFQFASSI